MKSLMVLLIAALLVGGVSASSAQQIEVMWLGNATTHIKTVSGKVILVDAFLKKNPKTPRKYKDMRALGKVDVILITHGHGDHVRDLQELAEITGATIVTNYEMGRQLKILGIIKSNEVIAMNKGGEISPIGRDIKIHMVPAEHSSSLDLEAFGLKRPEAQTTKYYPAGAAVGYVIQLENGFTIYHSGDTGIFGDMALINSLFKPDLALVYIAGHFGMGPELAAHAVKTLIKPKLAVPIHHGTFPIINVNPARFAKAMAGSSIKARVVKPGEVMKF